MIVFTRTFENFDIYIYIYTPRKLKKPSSNKVENHFEERHLVD